MNPLCLPFVCNFCEEGTLTYNKWLTHLTTRNHQMAVYQSPGEGELELSRPDVRDKVIVARKISLSTPLFDVATYFGKCGTITNLIYKGTELSDDLYGAESTMRFIIVYNSSIGVENAMSEESSWMYGKKIEIRRMFEPQRIYTRSSGTGPCIPQVQAGIGQRKQPLTLGGVGTIRSNSAATIDRNGLDDKNNKKERDVFENVNEFQKKAAQVKEDLSQLKLEKQVDSFCELLCLTSDQLQKRKELGSELLGVLKQKFPECDIYTFGHDYLGTATDIDTMNVMVDPFAKMLKMENKSGSSYYLSSDSELCSDIYDVLKKEQYKLKFCKNVEMKLHLWSFSASKIEKISFIHKNSGILCNLIVENYLVIQDSRLIRFMCSLDPRVHPLLCFVRFFSSVYDLLHTPNEAFKNHSMIWLLLNFLESQKLVPVIDELYRRSSSPLVFENTDISFCFDKGLVSHESPALMNDPSIRAFSVISLLQDFLKFYATANLKQNVVCPAVGRLVPVNAFGKTIGDNFPQEILSRYMNGYDGLVRKRRFYGGSPMGLQHPLDLVSNLTQDVPLVEVTRFQDVCSRAGDKLSKLMETGAGELVDIFINLNGATGIAIGGKISDPHAIEDEDSTSDSDESDKAIMIDETPEKKEDSSWEMGTDDEDDQMDENYNYEGLRKGKVRMNQCLRKYFEQAISKIEGFEDILEMDVRKKLQSLWWQYNLEFNSRFWYECFGFDVEVCSTVTEPETFLKTDETTSSFSLKERFESIKMELDTSGFEFRCETNEMISDLLYKKKVWKKSFLRVKLKPLWMVLSGKDLNDSTSTPKKTEANETDMDMISDVKKMVPIKFDKKMEFSCKLDVTFDLRPEEEIPKNGNVACFVLLILRDESYGRGRKMRAKKLRFLASVYERLAMKFCNLRIKQWIASCKDLDFTSFDAGFKKEKRKDKGHPKWRKFRKKWKFMLKEREGC